MAEFIELVTKRRSASNFLPDKPITKKEIDENSKQKIKRISQTG